MTPMTVQEIRHAVGGRALNAPAASLPPVASITTDTREMSGPALFIAVVGEKFDGHHFLADASRAGAIAALVQQAPDPDHPAPPNLHLIQVPDTRLALGRLAKLARQKLRAKVIAVAGSNGKTSTKLLIDAVLSQKLRGTASPKSYNNEIGVPLTLLPVPGTHDYVIVEIGTNHPGEVGVLSRIALPDIAIITSTAAEHLEFLINLAGVRRENASIIEGLSEKGLLILNGDDSELLSMLGKIHRGTRLTFGLEKSNDLFATEVSCDLAGTHFKINGRLEAFVPTIGPHVASNALVAVAVGRRLGLSEDQIVQGLAKAQGPEMRMQRQEAGGVTILNDAYNANPGSMQAALNALALLPAQGRRIVVLGDMLELGPTTAALHEEVGDIVAVSKIDLLVCIGPQSRNIATAAEKAGMASDAIIHFPDVPTAISLVPRLLSQGDLVLIKASRGMKLENVARAVIEQRTGAASSHCA